MRTYPNQLKIDAVPQKNRLALKQLCMNQLQGIEGIEVMENEFATGVGEVNWGFPKIGVHQ